MKTGEKCWIEKEGGSCLAKREEISTLKEKESSIEKEA